MSTPIECFGIGYVWRAGEGRIKATPEQCYQCKDFEKCCLYIQRLHVERLIAGIDKRGEP